MERLLAEVAVGVIGKKRETSISENLSPPLAVQLFG